MGPPSRLGKAFSASGFWHDRVRRRRATRPWKPGRTPVCEAARGLDMRPIGLAQVVTHRGPPPEAAVAGGFSLGEPGYASVCETRGGCMNALHPVDFQTVAASLRNPSLVNKRHLPYGIRWLRRFHPGHGCRPRGTRGRMEAAPAGDLSGCIRCAFVLAGRDSGGCWGSRRGACVAAVPTVRRGPVFARGHVAALARGYVRGSWPVHGGRIGQVPPR
jgi:hypothetical protein